MNHSEDAFTAQFVALTGHRPMPWQIALFQRFLTGDFPAACDLPTGLGKTSTIPIWLLALAAAPSVVPRRLVYVVNRRTVVDQATREAEKLKERLDDPARFADSAADSTLADLAQRLRSIFQGDPDETPLAISTLRGQYADNREWSADPSRPAVICGTVDMIGSRLLFSGYRCGFKSRPLHAGFLGQDVLLVHDEAHLEFPFQKLLTNIQREQQRRGDTLKKFHVMELSATSRSDGNVFKLSEADLKHAVVKKRLNSPKQIELHPIDDEKEIAEALVEKALAHAESGQAILVFARSVDWVDKVVGALQKDKRDVVPLTGTMRGYERDRLVAHPVFQRFLPPGDRPATDDAAAEAKTVYLVCTSAGEVGVNISADHLVCDLSTFDSMAQRFGRVNRFGDLADTRIDVVHPAKFPTEADVAKELEKPEEKQDAFVVLDGRRRRTLELLQQLNGAGSPDALGRLSPAARRSAFSPDVKVLPTSSILFDAWTLTTIHDRFPGRPAIEEYLHGKKNDYDPPRTSIAWREEVEILDQHPAFQTNEAREELLDDYPLKPHELLNDRTDRLFKQLQRLADRLGDAAKQTRVWKVDENQELQVVTVEKLIEDGKDKIEEATLILPPSAGGLSGGGLFLGSEPPNDKMDVADEWLDENSQPRRQRVWDDQEAPKRMRLIRRIDMSPDAEDAPSDALDENGEPVLPPRRNWRWYEVPKSGDSDGSKTSDATRGITLKDHTTDVEAEAKRITANLALPDDLRQAVVLAARFHDLGKQRKLWQKSIGNHKLDPPLAKASKGMKPSELNSYRHEFGSLIDLQQFVVFRQQSPDVQELILHLVAGHHGRARPHFESREAYDPNVSQKDSDALAAEIPLRFARQQRRYGRWGLAYLESLLRAADAAASANPTQPESK